MKVSSPTRTDMPSRIARVSGSTMRVVVPLPGSHDSCTWPPMSWILRRTTSMPTPRPEMSVTFSAVEKPGAKINCQISSSGEFSLTARPWAIAFLRILSRFRPAPSSLTSITMLPPLCWADSTSCPTGSLPEATRFSGVSMPWSRLLRTRWVSGSMMRSIRLLSSSVARPYVCSSICLPILLAMSRTRRGKRLNT
ncbi:hypothetical protein D9M68_829920 [compost metagenome]